MTQLSYIITEAMEKVVIPQKIVEDIPGPATSIEELNTPAEHPQYVSLFIKLWLCFKVLCTLVQFSTLCINKVFTCEQ